MEFSLTTELIEQIIFAMEDQENRYCVHRSSGQLLSEQGIGEQPGAGETAEESEDACVPIPEWRPVDGFLLMERFVDRLRNALLRDQLKEALASGRGVFRKFKDILKTRPEMERLWFAFKDRELRKVVWRWYNDNRELAGLERLKEEPEEQDGLEDLLGIDFAILALHHRHLEALLELDAQAFRARFPEADPGQVRDLFREIRAGLPGPEAEGSLVLIAETPEGEFTGFIWAVEESDPIVPGRILRVHQLAVAQRYQGMGLGALLLRRMVTEARDRGYHRIRGDLSGTCLQLAGLFGELGFKPLSQLMELDPTYWEE